jgi:hypothetical protein
VSDDEDSLVRLLTNAGLSWYGPGDPVHFSIKTSPGASHGLKAATQSWREGPGASIPAALGFLPVVGTAFRIAKDPVKEAKSQGSKLLDVILGFL